MVVLSHNYLMVVLAHNYEGNVAGHWYENYEYASALATEMLAIQKAFLVSDIFLNQ